MQPFLEGSQLVVHGDAQRLKAAFGRMSARPPCRRRDPFLNQLDKLLRRFDWLLLAPFHDDSSDSPRKFLFAVLKQNTSNFTFRPRIDDLPRRQGRGLIHPHIERRVRVIAKSPLPLIKLGGGNAEVEQDAIHLGNPV
ncbi:hypothetical protein D3C81_1663320 [compost metagenome]